MLSLSFRAAVSHYVCMHINIPLLFGKVDNILDFKPVVLMEYSDINWGFTAVFLRHAAQKKRQQTLIGRRNTSARRHYQGFRYTPI